MPKKSPCKSGMLPARKGFNRKATDAPKYSNTAAMRGKSLDCRKPTQSKPTASSAQAAAVKSAFTPKGIARVANPTPKAKKDSLSNLWVVKKRAHNQRANPIYKNANTNALIATPYSVCFNKAICKPNAAMGKPNTRLPSTNPFKLGGCLNENKIEMKRQAALNLFNQKKFKESFDLYAEIKIVTPKDLTDEQKALIEKLREP